MAPPRIFYFAQLQSKQNPVVINVVVVPAAKCEDRNGNFRERLGMIFLQEMFRDSSTVWVHASSDDDYRGPYPAPGDTYDFDEERFIPAPFKD